MVGTESSASHNNIKFGEESGAENVHKIINVGSFEVVVMHPGEILDRGEYSDWFIEIFIRIM